MTLPPFPSQDLAKLVLGYLAEEQLMTVYDEFLQASPYLDALRNEYDRIFMTSLKNILAEYRAVKIYVDTCKPFVLRKKIFQCTSLLDVVKFLVTNVDINKIQLQEAADKASLEKQNTTSTKLNQCETCHSKSGCLCKTKLSDSLQSDNVSHLGSSSRENSVETTPLEDLPGSHVTKRKKNVKVLEKDLVSYCSLNSDTSAKQSFSNTPDDNLSKCSNNTPLNTESSSLNNTVKSVDPSKSNQNIEEFNNVLESVVKRNKTISGSESQTIQRISNADTFQKFASGVSNGNIATFNVPDSSTENVIIQTSLTKDNQENAKGPPNSQLLLQVSHVNDNIEIQTCRGGLSKLSKPPKLVKIQPKPREQKIKIISDIKVGNGKKRGKSLQNASRNATSTPLVPMQTIVINGTPAFKHTPKSQAFTEDEIMAMPTLIVVPASGPSKIPTSVHCAPIMAHSCNAASTKHSPSPKVLGPLVIDVPSNAGRSTAPNLPILCEQKSVEPSLVKTVDTKNASVPKDSVITLESNNTPQILPPMRKSSSTPRRTSHVRVLDFTTPRRILHETINEQAAGESSDAPVEIIVSGSPDIVAAQTPSSLTVKTVSSSVVHVVEENDNGSAKENDVKLVKPKPKIDWDADLRALIGTNDVNISVAKQRYRNQRKRKSIDKNTQKDTNEEIQNKSRVKKSTRTKKTKNSKKVEDEECETPNNSEFTPPDSDQKKDVPLKPTINVISAHEPRENKNVENAKSKEDNVEDCADTPEAERLSLQNVIGAKLNISDIFETPYKQALYDIQMETPKFMDPDFPGEPLSDIKIMSIPTPRFLNTPKLVQATPSSNSSRPTDYSSGGSYYKPDDQDYLPIPEIMLCPVTSTKEVTTEKVVEKEIDEKKSRPVRKCTKNVSYYNSSINKVKDSDDVTDANSTCSETVSVNSSVEFKNKKDLYNKTPKRSKVESQQNRSKADVKKTNSAHRKRKSPRDAAQEKSKSFMKIKPRYTPKKVTPPGRLKKRVAASPYSKGTPNLSRKRTSSKEKSVNPTPIVTTALPTKSRRKSSTPRKLHCTKTFNSESSGHDSPEIETSKSHVNQVKAIINNEQESDTEHLALRWSDDGSQDGKIKDAPINTSANEIEDITKIQEFIDSSVKQSQVSGETAVEKCTLKQSHIENDGTLQRDLMKRGFDLETAKIIERDLLDDTPMRAETTGNTRTVPLSVQTATAQKCEPALEKTLETDSSTTDLHIVQDEEAENDEVELSVCECNEGSSNYIVFEHDHTKESIPGPPITLKDKFSMEVCLDDDLTVRLRATPFSVMLDQDPLTVEDISYNYRETEIAVSSICNIDRLYTPLKDSLKAQCYEIFDSTLTSLDTPLKARSPVKTSETSVTSLVLEEQREAISVTEVKKRKRLSVSDDSASDSKRAKQDADILFQTANIQNIDIESVLTKLHGP